MTFWCTWVKTFSLFLLGWAEWTNAQREVSGDQLIFYLPKSIPFCLLEIPGLKLPLGSELLNK